VGTPGSVHHDHGDLVLRQELSNILLVLRVHQEIDLLHILALGRIGRIAWGQKTGR